MAKQLSQTALSRLAPAGVPTPRRPRIAVVLNGNARAVTSRCIDEVSARLEGEKLFVSRALSQSKFIARQIVRDGYDLVLCGGGDGTFTHLVSDIVALRPRRLPAFGVLRLGTGNGLARVLGAASGGVRGVARDLAHARSTADRISLPLVRSMGRLTPFAGIGVDSMIIEDYAAQKQRLSTIPLLSSLGQGHTGYALAVATRSIWRYLREARPEVVIRNEGSAARPVDLRGNAIGPAIGRGEVLYRGPVTIAAASTVPFYGLGVRAFPQACLEPGRFQLRVANVPLSEMLARLPEVLSGDFAHDQLWDFSCSAVSMEISRPTPYQIGGDLVGSVDRVRFDVADVPAIYGSDGLASAPAPDTASETPTLLRSAVG